LAILEVKVALFDSNLNNIERKSNKFLKKEANPLEAVEQESLRPVPVGCRPVPTGENDYIIRRVLAILEVNAVFYDADSSIMKPVAALFDKGLAVFE